MTCLITAISLALLCTTAIAAELPPYWVNVEDHKGFHGVNNPNFPLDLNADLAEESFVIPGLVKALPVNDEENIVAVDEELTPEINDVDEPKFWKNQDENVVETDDNVLEGQQENNKDEESEGKDALEMRDNNKVDCDFIASPRISCYSCYTYIDCKSNGQGKVTQCSSPYAPYCNEGLCSATPTSACDPNPEPEDLEEASGDPNLN